MNKEIVEELKSKYKIVSQTKSLLPLNKSFNSAWKLETDKNNYMIKIIKNISEVLLKRVVISEKIARLFNENSIPSACAIENDDGVYCKIDNNCYLLYPWIDGSHLKMAELDSTKSIIISELLAKMHSLSIKDEKISPEYPPKIDINEFSKKVYAVNNIADSIKIELCSYAADSACFINSLEHENDAILLSHSDLHQENVLWTEYRPFIIDWELSGMTFYSYDLMSTAFLWSGSVTGSMDVYIYKKFIENYFNNYYGCNQFKPEIGFWHCVGWIFASLSYSLNNLAKIELNDDEREKVEMFCRNAINSLRAIMNNREIIIGEINWCRQWQSN